MYSPEKWFVTQPAQPMQTMASSSRRLRGCRFESARRTAKAGTRRNRYQSFESGRAYHPSVDARLHLILPLLMAVSESDKVPLSKEKLRKSTVSA
jgi:hypothetical protein